MKRKYRSPIIMDVTPIETENGISIIFGNSQETFGSDYTFNIDAWENAPPENISRSDIRPSDV